MYVCNSHNIALPPIFSLAATPTYLPWPCFVLYSFSLLIIYVWHPHNDIQTGVELSPLSNYDKIEKSKMAAITICAFIINDISRKIIELDTSFWCQTICFWYQGIIWNSLFTLLRCYTAYKSTMIATYVKYSLFEFHSQLTMINNTWGRPCFVWCSFLFLNIHVRHPHNDIQMGVELSPLSNFYKYIISIAICAFTKKYIYLVYIYIYHVIELETWFWCQTICFWYRGISWNSLFMPIWCYTVWKYNMVGKYVNFFLHFHFQFVLEY